MSIGPDPRGEAMNEVLTADAQRELRNRLMALPETMPPRSVWHRIEEQARAEGLLSKAGFRPQVKWLIGAGIAAAVVLTVLRLPGTGGTDDVGQVADVGSYSTPRPAQQQALVATEDLRALMVQSRILEQNLRAIPYQPRMMRASTAATISNLEDRIMAIDYRLNHPAIRMSPAQEQLYWRERVRLMDSLVKLRYAQVQRASF